MIEQMVSNVTSDEQQARQEVLDEVIQLRKQCDHLAEELAKLREQHGSFVSQVRDATRAHEPQKPSW